MPLNRTHLTATALAAVLAMPLTAAAQSDESGNSQSNPDDPSIYETAQNNASAFAVATLLIEHADLEETLNGEGPFTFFAPGDEAFDKIDKETMGALLDPANKEALVTLLQGHIVEGQRPAGEFIDQTVELTTLAGTTLTIEGGGELLLRNGAAPKLTTHDGKPALEQAILEASVPLVTITGVGDVTPGEGGDDGVDGSVVTLPDITAGNGIIHAISDVLVPADLLSDG